MGEVGIVRNPFLVFKTCKSRSHCQYKVREVGEGYVYDRYVITTNPTKAQRRKGIEPEVIVTGDVYGEYASELNDEITIHLDRQFKELKKELIVK